MEVFDDRVEIVNPGGLPKGLSIRNLGKVSIRRNELIADLFFRLHKVERIGMGIQKIREAMVAADLREPVFEPNSIFRATFYRSAELAMKKNMPNTQQLEKEPRINTVQKTNQKTAQKTNQKIMALIQQNPKITRQELADALQISDSGIKYYLKKMQDKELLRRVGPDKGGYWEIIA